jgi:hypothetical protein
LTLFAFETGLRHHLCALQGKWLCEGILVNNIFAVSTLQVTANSDDAVHADNFTIPIMELVSY